VVVYENGMASRRLLLVDRRISIDYQFDTLAGLADEVLLLRDRLNALAESRSGGLK
jgi:hypothetical protein